MLLFLLDRARIARSRPRALALVVEIVAMASLILLTIAALSGHASAQVADAGAGAAAGLDGGARRALPLADGGIPARPGPATTGGAGAADGGAGGGAADEPTSADADGGGAGQPGSPSTQAAGPVVNIPQTEADKATGQPILRIDISGNRRVAKDDIVSYLREKPGNGFRSDNLASDVRALWDSGFFDDIEVDMTREDRGVILRFLVRERPNIKSIEFEGNSEIEDEKLQEAIEVKANTILSVPAVRRSVQKIKDAYAEKGYFLADVESSVEPQRDNEVVVRFKVSEHSPVTVRRITFIGNYGVPDEDLRAVMETGKGSIFSFGSGGPYRQDVFERDVLLINALYYDKGYMNVQVGTPRVMLTPDREGIEIALVVREGPRFKIRQLKIYERDIDGREIEPLGGRRALRQLVRAKSGDFFNRAELVKDLQAVRTLYRDAGYANMEAEPETELDPVKREVDIIIPIRRGPLVHVERIEIKGNTKTRDKVMRREMEIEEGQLFSETKLEDSKRRMVALGYFERVDVSTEQGSTPETININFEVTERPTGTFQVGAGFSSIENFIATAQIQQANLFGNGQSLALQAQVSGLRQLISIRFFEPYFLDSDWSSSVELYDNLLVFPDFARQTLGGAITFGYALVQPWLRLGVTTTVQHDSIDTQQLNTFFGSTSGFVSVFRRLPLANLFSAGRTISLRPALTYDTRNNRLFPSSGVYLQASTEFASSALGSELEFLRHEFVGRFYYPLFGQSEQPGSGFILKMNNKVGIITSPLGQGVPIFARYFLGGILDVRGYNLRSLGPRLPLNSSLDVNAPPIQNGANIGGNVQYYSNLEFEFPIIDKVGIRGVTFFDGGNTWNLEQQFCKTTPAPQFSPLVSPCFESSSLARLRLSTGFGIRWFSPLGPLRFEWGFPLNKLTYEEPSNFQFTIGNFF